MEDFYKTVEDFRNTVGNFRKTVGDFRKKAGDFLSGRWGGATAGLLRDVCIPIIYTHARAYLLYKGRRAMARGGSQR